MKFQFNKKSIKFISIFSILIGAGIIVGLSINVYKNYGSNSSGAMIQDGVISGYTAAEIEEIMQRKADESTFSFEVNSRPVFENGKSEGNLRIYNPAYNNYLINVEIKLDSNNKTIFKSDKLKPNQYIEKAKLSRNLKKGEYEATATISAYDPTTEELLGISAAKMVIAVEN